MKFPAAEKKFAPVQSYVFEAIADVTSRFEQEGF